MNGAFLFQILIASSSRVKQANAHGESGWHFRAQGHFLRKLVLHASWQPLRKHFRPEIFVRTLL